MGVEEGQCFERTQFLPKEGQLRSTRLRTRRGVLEKSSLGKKKGYFTFDSKLQDQVR